MRYTKIVIALLIILFSCGMNNDAAARPRWYWRHASHRWHSWHYNDHFCSPTVVHTPNGGYYSREYRVHPRHKPFFGYRWHNCGNRRYDVGDDYRFKE